MACVRLKLHCVPSTENLNGTHDTESGWEPLSDLRDDSEFPSLFDPLFDDTVSQAKGPLELPKSPASNEPVEPPHTIESNTVPVKRARNTLAARMSRPRSPNSTARIQKLTVKEILKARGTNTDQQESLNNKPEAKIEDPRLILQPGVAYIIPGNSDLVSHSLPDHELPASVEGPKDASQANLLHSYLWTRIDKKLVDPETLAMGHEQYEEKVDHVIVLRVLTQKEIEKYVSKTKETRQEGVNVSNSFSTNSISKEESNQPALSSGESQMSHDRVVLKQKPQEPIPDREEERSTGEAFIVGRASCALEDESALEATIEPDDTQWSALHDAESEFKRPGGRQSSSALIHHTENSSTSLHKHRRHHSRTNSEIQQYEEMKRRISEKERREHVERQRREQTERDSRKAHEARRELERRAERPLRRNTWRDKANNRMKTLGLLRRGSPDIEIENSHKAKESILKSRNAGPSEVSGYVLLLHTLVSFVFVSAVFVKFNPDEVLSFIAYFYGSICVSRVAYVCCQYRKGQYTRWGKGQLSIDLSLNELLKAIVLSVSESSIDASLLYGWTILPTLVFGYGAVVPGQIEFIPDIGSVGNTSFERQNKITRLVSPWDAFWCLLGWCLMLLFFPQTVVFISGGRALDRYGFPVRDLQWSVPDLMSAGRSLKLRCEHLLQVRNMQPQSSGKRRVRGQCRCGYRFVDEFTEVRPAAAACYENLLQERSSHSKDYPYLANPDQGIQDATDAVDTNAQSKRSTAMSSIAGGLTTLITFAFSLLGKRRNGPTLPQYQLETGGNQPQRSSICNKELLFLLLCIPQHQFATRLLQPQISDITSDQGFFLLLRRNYRQMRGRMRRIFSMRTIRSIKFVQLEMYKSELVDIRKLDDLPPEDKKDEYRYNPVPADIIPPVGENHMLHLINHPAHAEEDGFVLDRIPKKLKERLLVPPSRGTGLGWGIYFIEGWHVSVITLVAFAVLLAGSLVFLVCWSVLEHDLQGASGVAAYMVAFLGLAIGSIQAVFELT